VPAPTATVLCVCTANVCRSPAAALLLRAGLRERLGAEPDEVGIQVRSAGTWASLGRPVEPVTAAALRAHGVTAAELAGSCSVPLRRDAVAGADLVLAAAAEHVRGVWRLQLAARQRTFTLGELAWLAGSVAAELLPPDGPVARLRALVSAADAIREARRPAGGPYVTEAYDLPDPVDDEAAQQGMVAQTAGQLGALLDLIAGRPRQPARLPWPRRAVQWSRSRTRRGAPR
jgi:protein-tyrosine phosphatase